MERNIVFILTEGDHDAAFIYRILKANGILTNHVILKDYPFPLNELFKNGISSIPIEDLNIDTARSRFLPSRVMQKGDDILSIYRIGGDSQEQKRIELIKAINAFNTPDPNAIQVLKDIKISILFFFDADNKGIAKRIEQLKKELRLSFLVEEEKIDKIKNKEIILIEDVNIGAFIFTEENKDVGLLEDILIPLMRQGNEEIFTHAEDFLDIHESTSLFKNRVTYNEDHSEKKKVCGVKYAYKKSLVGTVGQLQLSGKSNTVCISDADYLTNDKVKIDTTCVDIFDFIRKTIK